MIKAFKLLDQITIYSSANLSQDDINVVSLLYAPLIKNNAYRFYMTLVSVLNRNVLHSQTLLHKDLLDILGMNANEFYQARIRLEAIGLLNTYQNGEEYVLFVKAPQTSKQFLSDGVLGMYLYSEVGHETFKKLQKMFSIPKADKSNYTELTASFDDVFTSEVEVEIKNNDYLVDHKVNKGIIINNYNFDFNLFKNGISETFLENHRITQKFKIFITNIAYAYGFNEVQMQEVYNQSLNNSGHFDYTLCSRKTRELYKNLHQESLPKIAIQPKVEMSEAEALFDSLPAKNIIETATGMKVALASDIDKIQNLYQEYSQLPRSVINVSVVYSIKKCEGEVPAYSYFDTVLKDWINKGISTFESAKELAFREKNQVSKRKTKKSSDPDWLKDYVKNFEDGVEDL